MKPFLPTAGALLLVGIGAFAGIWLMGCSPTTSDRMSTAGPGGGGSGMPTDARTGTGGSTGAGGAVDAATDCCADSSNIGTGSDAGLEAGADSAADAARSKCTVSGNELCENFESGAIDPKVWGMHATAGASLTVDKEHAHGGTYALHVKLAAGGSNVAQITDAVTFPAKSNTFYTRAFFYFNPDLPADNTGGFHMAYLLATGNNDLGFVEAGLGSAGNKQYLGYSEYYGAGPDVHAHGPTFTEFGPDSTTRVVPQTWICLELMQGGDATTTMRRVWVDDKELPEQVSNFNARKPPAFSLMSIGVLQYHPSPILTDVWIDDIRVSSAKIGCTDAPP